MRRLIQWREIRTELGQSSSETDSDVNESRSRAVGIESVELKPWVDKIWELWFEQWWQGRGKNSCWNYASKRRVQNRQVWRGACLRHDELMAKHSDRTVQRPLRMSWWKLGQRSRVYSGSRSHLDGDNSKWGLWEIERLWPKILGKGRFRDSLGGRRNLNQQKRQKDWSQRNEKNQASGVSQEEDFIWYSRKGRRTTD